MNDSPQPSHATRRYKATLLAALIGTAIAGCAGHDPRPDPANLSSAPAQQAAPPHDHAGHMHGAPPAPVVPAVPPTLPGPAVSVPVTPTVAVAPPTPHHDFAGAERWAKVFDDPQRDAWQKPIEVIQALKLAPRAAVADIGAGTGYFATRLARVVPQGRVYAVDSEPDMIRYLAERAKKEGLANLVPVKAAPDAVAIPSPVDVALFVDVIHHIEKRTAYFGKLRGSLKPNGRIAIVDFNSSSRRGPAAGRVPPQQLRAELAAAGYVMVAEHRFLPDQYFLIFQPVRP